MDFLNFRFDTVEKQSIRNLSRYRSKSYAPVVHGDSEITFLREEEDAAFCRYLCCILFIYSTAKSNKSTNVFAFHTSGGISSWSEAFLLLILICTTLISSWVNRPCLMSSWLLIIFVIGLFVTMESFQVDSFQIWIHSSWLSAFSFALEVSSFYSLYLLFAMLFTIIYLLSFLILSIWPWIYSFCSFWYVIVSSLCAFVSFCALIFIGFLSLHKDAFSRYLVFSLNC